MARRRAARERGEQPKCTGVGPRHGLVAGVGMVPRCSPQPWPCAGAFLLCISQAGLYGLGGINQPRTEPHHLQPRLLRTPGSGVSFCPRETPATPSVREKAAGSRLFYATVRVGEAIPMHEDA